MTDQVGVLVVEDDADLAETYRAWLSDAYDVRVANSGTGGRRRLDASVDAVLLDRQLPDGSGSAFARLYTRDVPSISVGMVSAIEPEIDVLEMEFEAYLVKPVREDELLAFTEALLAGDTGALAMQPDVLI